MHKSNELLRRKVPHGSWASMSLEDRIELALRVHAEADRPFDFLPQAEKHAKVGEAKYRELRVKGFSEAAKAARAAVIKSGLLIRPEG